MTTADQRRCDACKSLIFPRLVTRSRETYSCGHPVAVWRWACWCGEVKEQPVERCPHCAGSRPPKGGDDV